MGASSPADPGGCFGDLLKRAREPALDVFDVNFGPTFSQLAFGKTATLVDIEAKSPTGRGYTHEFSRLGWRTRLDFGCPLMKKIRWRR